MKTVVFFYRYSERSQGLLKQKQSFNISKCRLDDFLLELLLIDKLFKYLS